MNTASNVKQWHGEVHYFDNKDSPTDSKEFKMHLPQLNEDGTSYSGVSNKIDMGSTKLQYQTFEHFEPYYHKEQERYVVDYCDRTAFASIKVRLLYGLACFKNYLLYLLILRDIDFTYLVQ